MANDHNGIGAQRLDELQQFLAYLVRRVLLAPLRLIGVVETFGIQCHYAKISRQLLYLVHEREIFQKTFISATDNGTFNENPNLIMPSKPTVREAV